MVVQSPFSPRFPSRGGPPLGQQEHLIWVDAGDFIFFADPALLLEQHKEQVKRSNVVATYSKAWAWGWLRDQWDTIWKMLVLWENHRKTKNYGKSQVLMGKLPFSIAMLNYQWDTIWKMLVLWENHRKTIGKWWFYPLVNVNSLRTGKSQFLMGQLTISMAMFNSYVSHYQRVPGKH